MNTPDTLGPLVDRIAQLQAAQRGTPHFEWGTITNAAPLAVRLDGDAMPLLGTPSTTVRGLRIGDRVRVEIQNRQVTIMGAAGGDPPPPIRTLWTGATYMHGTQTATLSELVSSQDRGIELVFSEYISGAASNTGFVTAFVSKAAVAAHPGNGFSFGIQSAWGAECGKYLYIHNDRIIGNQQNQVAPNNTYVLREVNGV